MNKLVIFALQLVAINQQAQKKPALVSDSNIAWHQNCVQQSAVLASAVICSFRISGRHMFEGIARHCEVEELKMGQKRSCIRNVCVLCRLLLLLLCSNLRLEKYPYRYWKIEKDLGTCDHVGTDNHPSVFYCLAQPQDRGWSKLRSGPNAEVNC